jgi:copper chaperone CopZ
MKKILFLFITFSLTTLANNLNEEHQHHSHEGHMHEMLVDGKKLEVDPIRFDRFVENLSNAQIAVVDVNGMVCDFCARGIEKAFQKDSSIKRIDVDLSKGKVLLAYSNEVEIDFDDIKKKILANGQNATGMKVLKI